MRQLYTIIGILFLGILTSCFPAKINLIKDSSEPLFEFSVKGKGKEKILIIPITGVISSKSEKGLLSSRAGLVQEVLAQLNKASEDPLIKAVVLKVDSPGGTVTASDILYHKLSTFRKRTEKPVVVSFLNIGASGAYYLSLPADKIFAHPTSVVGSIGVIFIRPKVHELLDKIGIKVAVSKSGKNKDLGSPFKRISDDEINFSQNLTNRLASRFFFLVEKHRKLTSESFSEIKKAGIYLPEKAKSLGLIDEIGYMDDAISEAIRLSGATGPVRIIRYRRSPYYNDTLYNTIGADSGSQNFPDLNISIPGFTPDTGFYYLSPVLSGF